MLSRPRALPAGFIAPCLPTNAPQPPSGEAWLHEIKHDGFRVIARKDGERVKLYSRPGNDLIYRFPLIVEAVAKLRSRSCIIDGEAVACGDDGIASFERIWRRPPRRGRDRGSTVRICGARDDCRTGSRAKSRTRLL
jgi:bifunctional non-homologous end joining protein LigD